MDIGYDSFVDRLIGQSPLFPSKNSKYNYAVGLTPHIENPINC
jgi:hypothetical protein